MQSFRLGNHITFSYAPEPATMVKHVTFGTAADTRQHDRSCANNSEAGPSNTHLKVNSLEDASCTVAKNWSRQAGVVDLTFGSKVSLDVHPIHSLQGDETHEFSLPLTQVNELETSIYADDRTPYGRHRSSSPATANKVMSEYYLWARKSKSLATVHSRASKDEFEETNEPVVKIKAKRHITAPTPWELGQHEVVDADKALEFYHWITSLQPRPAITA
jgi:hypothetical protein